MTRSVVIGGRNVEAGWALEGPEFVAESALYGHEYVMAK